MEKKIEHDVGWRLMFRALKNYNYWGCRSNSLNLKADKKQPWVTNEILKVMFDRREQNNRDLNKYKELKKNAK